MSGFEIAGVVLAVIPILQIGLEPFMGERFKTLLKHRQTIRSISRKLDIEHAQFHSTCEKLLSPLVDENRLAELLSNPKGSVWKDADLEEDLRDHLGDRKYKLYLSTIKELAGLMISLREELGLGDMRSKDSEKWYEKAAKRLKTSLKQKRYLEVLDEIRECNTSLHRLIGDVLEMTPIRTNRRTRLDTKKWESLRKLAESLHGTLEEGLACNCGHSHMAHLRLESRSDQQELDVRFSVLFSLDVFPRGWHETEIRIVRSKPANGSSPPRSANGSSRVQWDESAVDKDDDDSERTAAVPAESPIDDLCEELLSKRKQAGCIGFLNDESNREYYIDTVYPPTTLGDDLSLAQLLSRKQSEGIPALLSRDKYELAVILATSILQLHSTPWLDRNNWKEDIRFVRAKGKKSPFAYIQKRFDAHVQTAASAQRARRGSFSSPIRNETIFALGITLIELSLGRTLRYFETADDLGPDGQPNFLTDLSIAQRLVMEEVSQKEGERYANTVNRCINCIFDGIDPSLEDEQFRQAFYQSAVVPLKEVRDDFIK